jgi:hypothetical protein
MRTLLIPGRRVRFLAALGVAVCLSSFTSVAPVPVAADSLPSRLSDQEYWKLVTDFSEPNGFFRSDNLLSNESYFQQVIPTLLNTAKTGRVYMGVGPEQNFSYIVALKPAMAFIVDIRRGNLDLQLMYKALFELSADRAEFVGRLFARNRPGGLTTNSSAEEIFAAYRSVDRDEAFYNQNLREMTALLKTTHKFDLLEDDTQGIEYVYHAFAKFGPELQYSSSGSFGGLFQPTYADLMTATDASGQTRSFLANEENFRFMKDLETRNLLVPVVGNFAGPKAIRNVGQYLTEKGATVSAFYLSNVEQYLRMDGVWDAFCANVATLPLDQTSRFIRSVRRVGSPQNVGLDSELGEMQSEVRNCR